MRCAMWANDLCIRIYILCVWLLDVGCVIMIIMPYMCDRDLRCAIIGGIMSSSVVREFEIEISSNTHFPKMPTWKPGFKCVVLCGITVALSFHIIDSTLASKTIRLRLSCTHTHRQTHTPNTCECCFRDSDMLVACALHNADNHSTPCSPHTYNNITATQTSLRGDPMRLAKNLHTSDLYAFWHLVAWSTCTAIYLCVRGVFVSVANLDMTIAAAARWRKSARI